MAQPITFVKEEKTGFNSFGAVSESRESYIKMDASVRDILPLLKGARLHVFIDICSHIIDETPGASLTSIVQETGISRPTVSDAIQFLLDDAHKFIKVIGTEPDGTRIFAPMRLVWTGSDKNKRFGGKETLPPTTASGIDYAAETSEARTKNFTSKKIFSSCHDDDLSTQSESLNKTSSCHDTRVVEKILRDAGFQGIAVSQIAQTGVSEDIVREWAEWIPNADDKIRNPWGMAYKSITTNPESHPPQRKDGHENKTWWGKEHDEFINR